VAHRRVQRRGGKPPFSTILLTHDSEIGDLLMLQVQDPTDAGSLGIADIKGLFYILIFAVVVAAIALAYQVCLSTEKPMASHGNAFKKADPCVFPPSDATL
jgi:hypothetical protein